jgi:hypothetical protein
MGFVILYEYTMILTLIRVEIIDHVKDVLIRSALKRLTRRQPKSDSDFKDEISHL